MPLYDHIYFLDMKTFNNPPDIQPFYSKEYRLRMAAIRRKREESMKIDQNDIIKGRGMGYSFSVDLADKRIQYHGKTNLLLDQTLPRRGTGRRRSGSAGSRRHRRSSSQDTRRSRSERPAPRHIHKDKGRVTDAPLPPEPSCVKESSVGASYSRNGIEESPNRGRTRTLMVGTTGARRRLALECLAGGSSPPSSRAYSQDIGGGDRGMTDRHLISSPLTYLSPPAPPASPFHVPRPHTPLSSNLLNVPIHWMPAPPLPPLAYKGVVQVPPLCTVRHLTLALRQQLGTHLPTDFDLEIVRDSVTATTNTTSSRSSGDGSCGSNSSKKEGLREVQVPSVTCRVLIVIKAYVCCADNPPCLLE